MAFRNILSGMGISATGLQAERMRMEVASNNIANAHSTRGFDGGPYRRQQVSFAAQMDTAFRRANAFSGTRLDGIPGGDKLGGVQVLGITSDQGPPQRVYDPGHPDADGEGFVDMPNVQIPMEMVDLVTAGRAYEANLKAMEVIRQMAEQSLGLLSQIR